MDATVKVDCDFLGIPRGLKLCRVTIEEPFNGQYSVVYGGITENDRCLYNLYNQLSLKMNLCRSRPLSIAKHVHRTYISTSPQVILTSLNHEPGKHAMTR